MGSMQLEPLDNTTPSFNHPDHSPLNIMSPMHVLNEVHDFQKGMKCDITLYSMFKDDQ